MRYRVPASKVVSKRDPNVPLNVFVPLIRPLGGIGGPSVAAWRTSSSAVFWRQLAEILPVKRTPSTHMIPIVQEKMAQIYIIVGGCRTIDQNPAKHPIPRLDVEM
jgi:hypothetical protein